MWLLSPNPPPGGATGAAGVPIPPPHTHALLAHASTRRPRKQIVSSSGNVLAPARARPAGGGISLTMLPSLMAAQALKNSPSKRMTSAPPHSVYISSLFFFCSFVGARAWNRAPLCRSFPDSQRVWSAAAGRCACCGLWMPVAVLSLSGQVEPANNSMKGNVRISPPDTEKGSEEARNRFPAMREIPIERSCRGTLLFTPPAYLTPIEDLQTGLFGLCPSFLSPVPNFVIENLPTLAER